MSALVNRRAFGGVLRVGLIAASMAAAVAMLSVGGFAAGASAAFVRADTTTRGTWRGVYGKRLHRRERCKAFPRMPRSR